MKNIYEVHFEIFSSVKIYLGAMINKSQLFSRVSVLKSLSFGALPVAPKGPESTFAFQFTEVGKPEVLLRQASC